jgi:DNA-binding response OmpR family regulator
MGTQHPSRTTRLIIETLKAGTAPRLSDGDRGAVRTDVTRSTLRRKLGEPPVVQTVPRAGYRIGLS